MTTSKKVEDRVLNFGSDTSEEPKPTLTHENVDSHSDKLEPLENFILPGGSTIAALFHVGRTICRRAERNIVELNETEDINEEIIVYLNRLSDLFFILARAIGFISHVI